MKVCTTLFASVLFTRAKYWEKTDIYQERTVSINYYTMTYQKSVELHDVSK